MEMGGSRRLQTATRDLTVRVIDPEHLAALALQAGGAGGSELGSYSKRERSSARGLRRNSQPRASATLATSRHSRTCGTDHAIV